MEKLIEKGEQEAENPTSRNTIMTNEQDTIQTCPIRVTTEYRAPGKKEILKSQQECESMILITETVTGAVRSEKDPSDFLEKRSVNVESIGFKHPKNAINMIAHAIISMLHRFSNGSATVFAIILLDTLDMIIKSSSRNSDITICVSDELKCEIQAFKSENMR